MATSPRHAKTYRNFAAEYARLQAERIAAFREFIADVNTGAYPQPQHNVADGRRGIQHLQGRSRPVTHKETPC